MSYLAKILSIIIVVLTMFPCSDAFAQYDDNDVAQITLNTSDAQDPHSDGGDLCTPFCTCVCCASLVQVVKSIDISQPESLNIELNRYYISNHTSDFIDRNFQPPKV